MAKLKFNVDEFLPRLLQVAGVVNSKNTLPILGDVVFSTHVGESVDERIVTLMASDGETWLTVKVPLVEFDEQITFCVIATDIVKVLSNLKGKSVEMVLDEETHTIKGSYGNGRFALPFEHTDEYPRSDMNMDGAIEKEIVAVNLSRAISKCDFAIANDKLRPILNGIHFDFASNGMTCFATDGQKMARYFDKTVVSDNEETTGFTLPKKPANILFGLLANYDENVRLVFNNTCVSFGNNDFRMQTRLLEGNYPNCDRVIPKDNTIETIVSKGELLEALKRVMPMGDAVSELVRCLFAMGEITVSAEDFSYSKSADERIACDYASQELSIGFNGNMLIELLQCIDSDTVKICLKDMTRAGVFKPTDEDENEEFVALLMPLIIHTKVAQPKEPNNDGNL